LVEVLASDGKRALEVATCRLFGKLNELHARPAPPEVGAVDVAERKPNAWVKGVVVGQVLPRDWRMISSDLDSTRCMNVGEVRSRDAFVNVAVDSEWLAIDRYRNLTGLLLEIDVGGCSQ
jgi:hypothetical protein